MSRRTIGGARLLGAAALAGVTALSGCSFNGVESLPLPGGPDLGSHPRTVKIEFANVLDLVPQSAVKVNDVSVGKVEKIELAGAPGGQGGAGKPGAGWHAVVTVKFRGDVKLPDNAIATISQTSLLGEKFVQLEPPKNEAPVGELADDDLIPLNRTSRGTEIEEVLSAMSLLLNGGGLEQVSTISHELQAAMGGRESTIKSVLQRVNTFAGTLDQNRAAITRALDSIDRLTGKLSAERKTIRDTIDQTGPAIAVLNRNRADLTKMLVALNKLSRTTTYVINQSKADMLANLRDLDTILRNLNKAGSDLPKSLETLITFPFPSTFENVIAGDYGNVRLTVDLDFESIAQNLLGGTDLEGLLGSGKQMRGMLQVPNVTLPDSPLGVLPQMPGGAGQGGLPGLPGGTTQTPGNPAGGNGQGRPGALAPDPGDGGLRTLMTGGLS
ncbi:phospholipid/cholesterol/gamma-HCH transport system substrate-binding protein [Actinomadura coerulea]|uniref:Phospholipid/cholesterol/gamma-HCH transport system substrate-binding protein n=1 Tax=Actinomadura coerulea TaxID=46159 RepID=A0A7X0G3X9_9ACTN|nr:MCE family protein [Actinomadura coerulea]MBB6397916.1 phospholipid/cholesterol/gamma-HCH transport system substrate-binding protein [Actinomadura coerulea]GGQ33516.1 ABC transporter substrate-binding protein [Actinomadura coerulea]